MQTCDMSEYLPWWDERLAFASDDSRRAKYRRLQSRWRGIFLGLPQGTYGDKTGAVRELGSLLPGDSRQRDQLLSDEAIAYTVRRLPELDLEGRKAESGRLWLNMLSSQPLCFSLFGHLDGYPRAAARVLNSVLPWPIDEVESITVEHAPEAAALRLGGVKPDKTAFDAMLLVRSGSDRRLIGVETKYTEPFSQREYLKDSYHHVSAAEGSWFTPGAPAIAVGSTTNQLWRNLMLAQESARDLECVGSVVVVSAEEDDGATKAVAGMKPLLRNADTHLAHVTLNDMMRAALQEPELAEWSQRFFERYLNLAAAEPPVR